MLNHDINSIIKYSEKLHAYCEAWKNGAMGAQYREPIKILNRYIASDQNKSVLDWGCGDGHFSYLLGMKKFSVNSYSFKELGSLRTVLEKQFNNKFIFDKAVSNHPTQLPYLDEKFDAVFSVGVLEHVREYGGDEVASLQEINRILKPGGYCFIFHFPNKYSWIEGVHRILKRFNLVKRYLHNHLYTKQDIYELAKMANLSIVEISLYNLYPRNVFRLVPQFLGNNKVFIFLISLSERISSLLFFPFSQNYCVVMKKQAISK